MTTTDGAHQVIETLKAKFAATDQEITANAEQRRAQSYAAHAENESKAKPAKRELAALTDRALKLEYEREELRAAITEAERRLALAQAGERHAGDRALAERRLELAGGLRMAGQSMDAGLTAAKAEALWRVIGAIHETRFSHETVNPGPTHQQLNVLGLQALQTMLMATPWRKEFRHLAPHERRTWTGLCDGWAEMIERSARVELGEAQSEAA
jgi:hypothetical protein